MAEYTKEQQIELRARWVKHAEKLRALIPYIRDNPEWYQAKDYKALMVAVGVPEGVKEVERDLRGAPLSVQNLAGANLRKADLFGAELGTTQLPGADLRGATLSAANMVNANLSGANLQDAYLYGTSLKSADLSHTKSWVNVEWNAKDRSWRKGKKLKPSERKTKFWWNDIRNANWTGAALIAICER